MNDMYIFLGIAFIISLLIINYMIMTAVNAVSNVIAKHITHEVDTIYRKLAASIEELQLEISEHADAVEPDKLDRLLYDVAIWAIKCNGLSISAVQRHFSISFRRAGIIVDQLHSMGICGSAKLDGKPRPILVTMDEVIMLKRNGGFDR